MADQNSPQNLGGNLQTVQTVGLGSAMQLPAAQEGTVLSPSFVGGGPPSTGNGTAFPIIIPTIPNLLAQPVVQGALAIDQATNALYCGNNGNWCPIVALVAP